MISDGQGGRPVQVGNYLAGGPLIISLSVVSANVQLQPYSTYRLWSSVDAFFDTAATNAATATTSSHPLTAKLDTLHSTDNQNIWLAGVVAAGTGTLFISQVRTTF